MIDPKAKERQVPYGKTRIKKNPTGAQSAEKTIRGRQRKRKDPMAAM